MSVPDDEIDKYLSMLFGRSEPGAMLHHMVIADAPRGSTTALGVLDPKALEVAVYAIDPYDDPHGKLIPKVVMGAVAEHHERGEVVHFAGLAMEVHVVQTPDDRARRLYTEHRLRTHPDAVEQTRLYAACSDGRRWSGYHTLTGPKAGTVVGPTVRVGALSREDQDQHSRLMRAAVGWA